MSEDALTVIETYTADPEIKVVVMRGAGEKAFISGGDISNFEKNRANAEMAARARKIPDLLSAKMRDMGKPLIAMIHGYCLGGGMGMALNADLRFASSKAQFGVPAAQRGIAYPPNNLKKLVDLVGPSVTKDIMFSARRVPADEALRLGIINRVFEPEELEAKTLEYANVVAGNAPLSVKASKYFINQLGLERAQRDEAKIKEMIADAANSEDFKEATRSFMEKRKPVFQGR
jgi:enoyl-CoA hydratase/carnithine racemase